MAKKKSQISDFRKAARELGADKSEKRFNAALKAVVRHKPTDDGSAPQKAHCPLIKDKYGRRS